MHEWGITESIIKEIIKQAEENGLKKIDKICLSVGEDAGITSDSLEFCFQNLAAGTILESVKVEIERCNDRAVTINSIEGSQ